MRVSVLVLMLVSVAVLWAVPPEGTKDTKEPITITYDLLDGKLQMDDNYLGPYVENGTFVTVQVLHVNPFLYDVAITGKILNYNTDSPALFKEKMSLAQAPIAVEPPSQEDHVKQAAEMADQQVDAILKSSAALFKAGADAGDLFQSENSPHALKPMTRVISLAKFLYNNADLDKKMSAIAYAGMSDEKTMYSLGNFLSDNFVAAAKKEMGSGEAVCSEGIFSCAKEMEAILEHMCDEAEMANNNFVTRITALQAVATENLKKPKAAMKKEEKEKITGRIAIYEKAVEEMGKLHQTVKTVCEAYVKDKEKINDKYRRAEDFLTQMKDSRFTMKSLPVQADGDAILFSLSVKRKANLDNSVQTPYECEKSDFIRLDVSYTQKLDFSEGLFISRLKDNSYVLDDHKKIARKGEENDFSVAVGVLVHAYSTCRAKDRLCLATSFGLALGPDQQVQYYLGESLIWGKQRRGIFTIGIVGGQVKRLGAGLSEGDEYTGTDGNIPMESVFRCALFAGITFNF